MGADGSTAGSNEERPIGDVVNRISENASLLIREEVELAKAEIEQKVKQIARGAITGAVAGFFVFMGLIMLLEAGAWGINDVLDSVWLGFLIMGVGLFVFAALGGWFAARSFKAGTPPTPDKAIEEARLIREAIEHPEVQAAMSRTPEAGETGK